VVRGVGLVVLTRRRIMDAESCVTG
jgi:hypothetical protein